jgi:hypothetical protein
VHGRDGTEERVGLRLFGLAHVHTPRGMARVTQERGGAEPIPRCSTKTVRRYVHAAESCSLPQGRELIHQTALRALHASSVTASVDARSSAQWSTSFARGVNQTKSNGRRRAGSPLRRALGSCPRRSPGAGRWPARRPHKRASAAQVPVPSVESLH